MSNPKQLAVGDTATFIWSDTRGKPDKGTWRVGEFRDATTTPETQSKDWLAPFIGKKVGTTADVSQPEDNVLTLTLIAIDHPDSDEGETKAA